MTDMKNNNKLVSAGVRILCMETDLMWIGLVH